jgi:hypothetical protein
MQGRLMHVNAGSNLCRSLDRDDDVIRMKLVMGKWGRKSPGRLCGMVPKKP